jgi:hypothetical protein
VSVSLFLGLVLVGSISLEIPLISLPSVPFLKTSPESDLCCCLAPRTGVVWTSGLKVRGTPRRRPRAWMIWEETWEKLSCAGFHTKSGLPGFYVCTGVLGSLDLKSPKLIYYITKYLLLLGYTVHYNCIEEHVGSNRSTYCTE